MKNKKMLIAGSLAAAMLLMGGAIPAANAGAASTSKAPAASTTGVKFAPNTAWPKQQLGSGLGAIQDDLLKFLNLDAATFKKEISSKSLAEIAEEHNISRDNLKEKLVEWLQNAQITKTKQKGTAQNMDISAIADKIIDSKGLIGGKQLGKDGNPEMTGKSDELASALGLTADKLKEALKSGQTLAQIAASQKVDVAAVTNLLAGKEKERLDALLKNGKVSQDQYTKQLADFTDRVDKMITGKFSGKAGFGSRGERFDDSQGERHLPIKKAAE